MNKKMMRIITILATIVLVLSVSVSVFATDIVAEVDTNASINHSGITGAGSKIATIIRIVGAVAAVIILMILGIKYMMGSASEKAEYKKTMIPYVIGAVVLFGASAIASAVVELAGGITSSTTT